MNQPTKDELRDALVSCVNEIIRLRAELHWHRLPVWRRMLAWVKWWRA